MAGSAWGRGTLYALLERFEKDGLIRRTRTEDNRKYYILMPEGERTLQNEYERIKEAGGGHGAGASKGGRVMKRRFSLLPIQ